MNAKHQKFPPLRTIMKQLYLKRSLEAIPKVERAPGINGDRYDGRRLCLVPSRPSNIQNWIDERIESNDGSGVEEAMFVHNLVCITPLLL